MKPSWLIYMANLHGSISWSAQASHAAARPHGLSLQQSTAQMLMRTRPLIAQLVHVPQDDDDINSDDNNEDTILHVSRVEDEFGQPLQETGRSVASMQLMITRASTE